MSRSPTISPRKKYAVLFFDPAFSPKNEENAVEKKYQVLFYALFFWHWALWCKVLCGRMAMREETRVAMRASEMCRADLGEAWLSEIPQTSGIEDVGGMMALMREKLIVCESLEVSQALAVLEKLVGWLRSAPEEPAAGRIVPAAEAGAEVLTLYTDTTPIIEWPGLARVGHRWTFAFGKEHVFLPAPEVD